MTLPCSPRSAAPFRPLLRRWSFVKAHGLGNDFLLHLGPVGELDFVEAGGVQRACERRTGVGADGVILLEPLPGERRARMRLFNSDGGEAEISANGLRCLAAFAHLRGLDLPEDLLENILYRNAEELLPPG